LVLFIFSVATTVMRFFHHSRSPLAIARDFQATPFGRAEDVEIDREMADSRNEGKLLKRTTLKVTKMDINTLEDIENYLQQIVNIVRDRGNSIGRRQIDELTQALRRIVQKEDMLKRGMGLIKKHVAEFQSTHRKDVLEIEKRLAEAKNKKERRLIQEELSYQKRMLQVMDFMQRHERKVLDFCKTFNSLLTDALQKLKSHYPKDALSHLEQAHNSVVQMKHIYEHQKEFEKYLLKLNKNAVSDFKKEKQVK
jgi:hypothetical protein